MARAPRSRKDSAERALPAAKQFSATTHLVDRMTGKLGTHPEIEARGKLLQSAVGPILSKALNTATGFDIDVRPGEIRSGSRRDLLASLNKDTVYCTGKVRDWSSDLCFLCDTSIIVALVECLLGGTDPDEINAVRRPLSTIELDMSLMVFEQITDALKGAVLAESAAKTSVARPEANVPPLEDDPLEDFHAAAICFQLEFGTVAAPIFILVRQSVLLKLRHVNRPDSDQERPPAQQEWSDRLGQRVASSKIRLEARIGLDPLDLDDVSRLQVGDLLAFTDTGDTKVTLMANGKALYSCALGRSGQRYMVRVEDTVGADVDWRSELG